RVVINRKTGDYDTYRWWEVVGDDVLAELGTQLTTEEAAEKDPNLKVGDIFEEQVENINFGRIAAQFVGHRLHPGPAHADTGADGVDAAVIGLDGDLGAGAGVAGGAADLDDLLGDLRHLDGEQLHQHLVAGAAQEQLGPAGLGA